MGRFLFGMCLTALLSTAATTARAADREVKGRVIDADGRPVAGASVGPWWSANGKGVRADGSLIKFPIADASDIAAYWGHVGEMQPRGGEGFQATTGPDGTFRVKMRSGHRALIAMDADRKNGGLILPPGRGEIADPVEIRLAPLTRVTGRVINAATGEKPYWWHVYIDLPADPTRPLDSDRVALVGSFDSSFEMLLPPGTYTLDAHGESVKAVAGQDEDVDLQLTPKPQLVIAPGSRVIDLGTLAMGVDTAPSRQKLEDAAKKTGRWLDVTKHYGEAPPKIHAVEGRGIAKDGQIADFRGKWVLVYFWGPSCSVCLGSGMPKLMKFQDEHEADRDRFAILSVCIDFEGELKTLADVDHSLKDVVDHVWKGKTPRFPILFDPSFATWERFGLPGLGTALLIDPEGRMVEGDEATLAEKLKKR